MFNIRSVDLNLLPVFEAVYEEQNLSRAAARLAMTQSAVSHAMTRLRAVFRDELFVRHARGVTPTPAAESVYAKVHESLAGMRGAVMSTRSFDARSAERAFFLGIPHPLGPLLVLRLQERLHASAPNIHVAASTRSRPLELERALRDGQLDAVVDWLPPQGGRFESSVLFEDRLVAIARSGHPALRTRPSLATLRKGRYVSLRPRVEGRHPVAGVEAWRRLGLEVVIEVSEVLEIFMVVRQSDLFGLVPRSMAALARETLDLRTIDAGPHATPVPILLCWHDSRTADPAHRFLRREIADVMGSLTGRTTRTPRAKGQL